MNVRIIAMTLVAAGFTALGVASAQNVPSQFVVSGKAAEQIQDFTTINLATAERIAETCEKLAAEQNVAISMYVLDNDGNHVYMDRMDGQGYLNIITAEMKARTALMQRGAEQGRHEPGPSESEHGAAADSARHVRELRRPARRRQQADDRRHRHRRLRAARAGVERRDLRPQGDAKQVLGAANVAPLDRGSAESAERAAPRTPRRFRDSRPRRRRRPACRTPSGSSAARAQANVFDGNQISLAAAKKIAKVCRDFAAAKSGSMSLYILDTAGNFVHMERMDGQVFNNIRTALMKAETSLKTQVPTSVYTAQGRNNPAGQNRTIDQYDFFTNAGGLPIVVDGQMIGVIGVGGGAGGGGDENCAIEGLKATFGEHVTLPVYPTATTAAR